MRQIRCYAIDSSVELDVSSTVRKLAARESHVLSTMDFLKLADRLEAALLDGGYSPELLRILEKALDRTPIDAK